MPWNNEQPSRDVLLSREWLVTNGLGGYASGTFRARSRGVITGS